MRDPEQRPSQIRRTRRAFLKLSAAAGLGFRLRPFTMPPEPGLHYLERAAFTMGSIVTVKAYAADPQIGAISIEKAFAQMKTVDRLASVFDPLSQLSVVNRDAHTREVPVDQPVVEIIDYARRFHGLTGGAFDVTVEPLMELYGFRDAPDSRRRFPSDRQIGAALDAVGMDKVVVDHANLRIGLSRPGTELDFGGIAVGYALDRAAEALIRAGGVHAALLNHSGDLLAVGSPPGEDGWEIGITDPSAPEEIITTARIRDRALSTSGNYRNFIRSEDRTIGHILDPHSGVSPAAVLSTTAIARTAVEADAMSTAFFVLGVERSRQVLSRFEEAELIAVVAEGDNEEILRIGGS